MSHEIEKVDLVGRDFDLALRLGPLADSGLVAQRLGILKFGLYAAPDYLLRKGNPVAPVELEDHDWLRLDIRPRRPLSFVWQGASVEIKAAPRVAFSDVASLRDGVLQGLGISMLAHLVAAPWLELGMLSMVLPEVEIEPAPVFAVHAGGQRLKPTALAFVKFAKRAIGDK
jgi:LysR family transcriptional regulator for bpeEF and oprC